MRVEGAGGIRHAAGGAEFRNVQKDTSYRSGNSVSCLLVVAAAATTDNDSTLPLFALRGGRGDYTCNSVQ